MKCWLPRRDPPTLSQVLPVLEEHRGKRVISQLTLSLSLLFHLLIGCHGLPVLMAGQFQQLQPSNQLLLSHIHSDHEQEVESEWRPEPQASEAQRDEAAPVQQRGGFDQSDPQLRLTWRHACDAFSVEASGLGGIEVVEAGFLLGPAVSAPGLQIRGRGRQ